MQHPGELLGKKVSYLMVACPEVREAVYRCTGRLELLSRLFQNQSPE
jgi:hypothetical protein